MASSNSSTSNFDGTTIFLAALGGDLHSIEELVKYGGQRATEIFGDKDLKGRSILHYAATGGQTHVCKYLVETIKFDVHVKDFRGDTPLHSAVLQEHYMTSSYLLEHGALPNMANDEGATSLHFSADAGRIDLMRLLITKGAEVDAPSYLKGTPLRCAVANGMIDAVKMLLDHKADPNSDSHPIFTPFTVAIVSNSLDCVRLMLKYGADPNFGQLGEKPLFWAVNEADIEIIKCLLKAGADPNATNFYDYTPIEVAAIEGNLPVVILLFDVTARLPSYPVWSCQGIIDYVDSPEAKAKRELMEESKFLEAKENGAQAFHSEDYLTASYWYKVAMKNRPMDATVFSNRSLCFVRLNDGENALQDALCCVRLKPDWSKAYYRVGIAWKMMKVYDEAAEAFEMGLSLNPHNKHLQDAYKETLDRLASEQHH